jgi:hypothetical protein
MRQVRLNVAAHEDSGFVKTLQALEPNLLKVEAHRVLMPKLWRILVRGTLMEPASVEVPAPSPVHAQASDLQCSFEDQNGRPLFLPFTCIEFWERSPYFVTIRLVAANRRCLGEARVGSRGPYARLLDKLAQSALLLLRQALSRLSDDRGPILGAPIGHGGGDRRHLALAFLRRGRSRLCEQLLTETWGIGESSGLNLRDAVQTGLIGPIRWIRHGDRHGFFADPFAHPGRTGLILCERFVYRQNRGEIVALADDDPNSFQRVEFPQTTHLSYPCMWQEARVTFVMPESGASGRTIIYKLNGDLAPEPVATILDGRKIADATLFRIDSRYWIAYTDCEIGLHDNLCLLHSDDLRGPWVEHVANPVKIDICSARSAGTPFQLDGKWYRPAQDCSAGYGCSIAINEIEKIDELHYQERIVAYIRPDPAGPYPDGIHTLSIQGDRAFVDGKRRALFWDAILRKVWRRVRRRPATITT